MRKLHFFTALILFFTSVSAQEKSPVKFGKISADDFKNTVYSIDSNAAAVVIADIGYSYYEGNENGWFSFFHDRHKRIRILNKNGYNAANVEVVLYVDGAVQEQLQSLKAYTYNVENGKVVETKLESKSVFTDKLDKNHCIKKFTFPNVKEGSIVEFSYTIRSDYWSSPANWYFQGEYPVLWSELEFHIPEFFYFVFITEGYNNFYKKQPPVSSTVLYDVTLESLAAGERTQRERRKIEAQVFKHRWVIKDAPGLRAESFTSSIKNHISKIEFQLAEIRRPLTPEPYMQSWQMLTQKLLMSEYFGLHLNNPNNWMDDEISGLTKGLTDPVEKAKRVYNYIRDNFTCLDYSARYMSQVLKSVLKAKKGNVADLNLLLVAMLRSVGINAEPILLSTKSHGYTYAMYPLIDKFNYVIAAVEIDGKKIFLDATKPKLKFGVLPYECYNGFAVAVNKDATHVTFNPDSIIEKKLTAVFLTNSLKGKLEGKFQQTPGVYESITVRSSVAEKSKENFISDFGKSFLENEGKIITGVIDSLNQIEEPLSITIDFEIPAGDNEVIYFAPLIAEGFKENPFKSLIRHYPVEMPYGFDETYILRMEVPEGYVVEEIPKSAKVNFDETGSSFFEYIIESRNDIISLRTRIKLLRTYFLPEEYEILREFFSLIVSKHNEQIVFKKKK